MKWLLKNSRSVDFKKGLNIPFMVQFGSALSRLFTLYKARVLAALGIINDESETRSAFSNIPAQDSIRFAWLGTAGSKKRTSTIYDYYTKLYDMQPTVDGDEQITVAADRDFSSDTGDWKLGSNISIGGGVMSFSSAENNFNARIENITEVNKWYKITYTISNYISGNVRYLIGDATNGTLRSSNGTFVEYAKNISTSLTGNFYIQARLETTTLDVDNVSVIEMSSYPNDATQTTESLQPYVTGNIAPSEYEGLQNPNGDSRYMEHDEISFAATDEWSVTTCLNWNETSAGYSSLWGGNNNYYGFYLDYSTSNMLFITASGNTSFGAFPMVGKNAVLTFVYEGTGECNLYINGLFFATGTLSTSLSFTAIARIRSDRTLNGTINAHLIRSQALTPAQVLSEATFLSTIYPDIPSVDIGTQTWQTSNVQMVATPMGSVIANVTEPVNVEVVPQPYDLTSDWLALGTGTITGANTFTTSDAGGVSLFSSYVGWCKVNITHTSSQNLTFRTSATSTGSVNIGTSTTNYTFYYYKPDAYYYIRSNGINSATISSISIEEIGWSGSQDLYDGLIAQGETVQAALEAAAMWCYYDNDSEIGSWAGKLYNWFAIALIQADIDTYNAANPTAHWGYHVPSSAEFTNLQTILGGSAVAGGYMKKDGLDYWSTPNTGADNSSGFSGLPCGYRNESGSFIFLNSNTNIITIEANAYRLSYNSAAISLQTWSGFKQRGSSLRFISDTLNDVEYAVSYTAVEITQTGTIAEGNVQYQTSAEVIAALPTEIAVTLNDASVVNIPVTWTDTDTYDPTTAADYTFTGTWGTIPEGVSNGEWFVPPTTELTVAQGTHEILTDSTGDRVTDSTGDYILTKI